MNWWQEYASRIQCDVLLAPLTWFRLGGRARCLFQPRDVEDLASLIVRAREEEVPVKVLGCGANVLVSDDGFDGVVVQLNHDRFRAIDLRGVRLDVGAGVDLMPLTRWCSERGLSGLECLAGIPATIGGAIRMNAGGRFGDIGCVVREIGFLNEDGTFETWPRERMEFGYRQSGLGQGIVVSAVLELAEDDPSFVKQTFEKYFAFKRRSQPLADKSAGCIFKNPPGQSAGVLIEQAGLKGVRCGRAEVSSRHANFIIAQPGATSLDVLHLIDVIRERVRQHCDTDLEIELDIWPPHAERTRHD